MNVSGTYRENGCVESVSYYYHYGFNGMESDNEMYNNEGTSYDFGSRMYDSRLGRFLSIDEKGEAFSYWSPYIYAANSPISLIDVEGKFPDWPSVSKWLDDFSVGFFEGMFGKVSTSIPDNKNYYLCPTGDCSETAKQIAEELQNFTRDPTGYIKEALVELGDDAKKLYDKALEGDAETIGFITGRVVMMIALRKVAKGISKPTLPTKRSVISRSKNRKSRTMKNNQNSNQKSVVSEKVTHTNKIPEGSQGNHVFESPESIKAGKIKFKNTPENRSIIESIATKENYIGSNEYGQQWYSYTTKKGTQFFVYTKDGVVKGAGINTEARDLVTTKKLTK